ncbi:TetR/AcrR family transcriptional regulator [Pseudonocardia alni]|uniref:TetR/AcrR family transcriptional regulator n=1 Tax=Pseudonocardia alni TaxID=33907 RepID=UPI00280A8CA2|nr:WHG domain-containing protein [Pseudonocardia alni]
MSERVGLTATRVVAAGAALADEVGFPSLTMGMLAKRMGVRTPSLYKHVAHQEDLHRRIAVLAVNEAAVAMESAIRGRTGRDALTSAMRAFRGYVLSHPGRYAATIGVEALVPDDPMACARDRFEETLRSTLQSYPIGPAHTMHAMRALRSILHGFASLQAAHGFQHATDIDESFEWLIDVADRGLRSAPNQTC